MRSVAALLVLAIATTGCSDKQKPGEAGLSGTCGLRKIAKNVDEDKVANEFLLDGVEIANTQRLRGRFIATINAPYSVNEAYREYQDQVKEAGWDIVTQETEGFEAEIYLSDDRHLAAIQIRTSTCEGKVVVYVSIVDREDARSDN
ncbi:MAG: hypothetical protein KY391_01990 [Actinobacteria bacterium]|nr:hypothetical protein [Actinomycetota bacterium]